GRGSRRARGHPATVLAGAMSGPVPALPQCCRTLAVLVSFIGLLFFVDVSVAAEVIQSFDSHVRVAKDGELTVKEVIRVRAEGNDIRHGIYRDFPLTFRDASGAVREVDFRLIGVERDGRAETYSTTRQQGIIRIYAGDKDTVVSRG